MIKIKFSPFPVLKTERLNLRQLTNNDEKQIFLIRSNENMAEFLNRPLCKNIEEASNFINKINALIANNECIYWAVTLKGNPKLIGTICLWQISTKEAKAEIGFELLPEYQGRGIIQEAVKSVLDYGFNKMNLSAIEGEVAPGNIKSIKIMEKFGFKKINEIRENDSIDVEEGRTVMYSVIKQI
ncbi:MAG: GNAT family N-acetyltransferase [Bacteroidetes bacterium]|nr:GNAT family N-acetyltransferase [Bacteroidota bacterium]